jgi:hypothetical protein
VCGEFDLEKNVLMGNGSDEQMLGRGGLRVRLELAEILGVLACDDLTTGFSFLPDLGLRGASMAEGLGIGFEARDQGTGRGPRGWASDYC